jgi:protoporphyrinogen IX oxidase
MIVLWVKIFHIVAVIAFMAGMLYLPRLFVYHAGVAKDSSPADIFKIMERRLETAIMRPAFVIAVASGLALARMGGFFADSWLRWKLALVLLMSVNYGYLIWTRYRFAADANRHSARFFKILNEIPTLLLIGIVVLAVVKPG